MTVSVTRAGFQSKVEHAGRKNFVSKHISNQRENEYILSTMLGLLIVNVLHSMKHKLSKKHRWVGKDGAQQCERPKSLI